MRTLEAQLEPAPLAGVWFRPAHPPAQVLLKVKKTEIITRKAYISLKIEIKSLLRHFLDC